MSRLTPAPMPSRATGSRPAWARVIASATLASAVLFAGVFASAPAYADFVDARGGRDVIIGRDNDNPENQVIQPPGTAANQSLNNTDVQVGGAGNDVLIGVLGNDVQIGESGDDVLIGGPENGVPAGTPNPNSDVQFGGSGNDVSIWAPGDGSDFFNGGAGNRDAQVVGLIDRDPAGPQGVRTVKLSPIPGYQSGLPTVDVSGLNAQCTIDKVPVESELGYEFLVRFRNAAGALVVTMRQVDVEQVFCPSTNGQAAQGIVFASLRDDTPSFRPVTLDEVKQLNPLVGQIIR